MNNFDKLLKMITSPSTELNTSLLEYRANNNLFTTQSSIIAPLEITKKKKNVKSNLLFVCLSRR